MSDRLTGDVPVATVPVEGVGVMPRVSPRVSWAAIFAGAFVVIAIALLLGMLGAGVGLGLVQPEGGPTARNLSLGAGLWWLGTTIVAFLIGSYVAARLAGVARRYDGMLHGLVIWGLAVLVTFYVLTSAFGNAVSGAFSVIGSTISAAGEGIKSVAPQLTSSSGLTSTGLTSTGLTSQFVQQQAQGFLGPATPNPANMSKQDAAKAIADQLPHLASGGDEAAHAKEQIINIMAAQLNLSHDEAAKRFDAAEAQFEQVRKNALEGARKAAGDAAQAASRVAYVTFGVMLLDAIAACLGGALASPGRGRRLAERDRLSVAGRRR